MTMFIDHHQELVLVFMPYYYWFDGDFIVLSIPLKNLLQK